MLQLEDALQQVEELKASLAAANKAAATAQALADRAVQERDTARTAAGEDCAACSMANRRAGLVGGRGCRQRPACPDLGSPALLWDCHADMILGPPTAAAQSSTALPCLPPPRAQSRCVRRSAS